MRRLVTGLVLGLLAGCGGTTEHSHHAHKPAELPAPAEAPRETSCPVLGTWEGRIPGGPFEGETMRFDFAREEGSVMAVAGPSPVNQSWSLYDNVLSVQDLSESPYTGPCSAEQSATYEIGFDPSCTEMRIIAIEDPCEERRRTMDWLVLTLQ